VKTNSRRILKESFKTATVKGLATR